jgi:hypothetical protein
VTPGEGSHSVGVSLKGSDVVIVLGLRPDEDGAIDAC